MARILIVEDEPSLREVERDILRDEGYETLEAADGGEARGILRASAEAFVVLLDNRLPDMEGGDLLREAVGDPSLARHAYIFASGVTPAEYPREVREAMEALEVDDVPKPFDVERLLEAVERAVERLAGGGKGQSGPGRPPKGHSDGSRGKPRRGR